MSFISNTATLPEAKPARVHASYEVTVERNWRTGIADWSSDGVGSAGSPFQEAGWYQCLYGVLERESTIAPLIVTARSPEGQLAVRLPLVVRSSGRLRTIEFADHDLTDYNCPQIGPAAPTTPIEARQLWQTILRSLPKADVIRLRKLPGSVEGRLNPLALLAGARNCPANGNIVVTGDDWDAHRFTREKTVRKELERSWRVFTRDPQACFKAVTAPNDIANVLSEMEQQQATRMHSIAASYVLDEPLQKSFYRDLVSTQIASGYASLTSLMVGDEIVASLLGIRRGDTFLMIRISNAAGRWTNVSPGRLIIEKTMEHMHVQGVRRFDFSIGNYAYKRRFGVEAVPLWDYTQARSLTGLLVWLRDHVAAKLRQHPAVRARVLRLFGREEAAETN